MSKLDNFKKFVSHHPEFIDMVRSDETSWQKLYELYDIYGESNSIWDKYIKSSENSLNLKGLLKTIKNINLDSLEESINSIQKAVGLVEEFTKSEETKEKVEPKNTTLETLYGEDNEHNSTK